MLNSCTLLLALIFVIGSQSFTAIAAGQQQTPRRARPPHWSQDVLDAFFNDAREQLVGNRPEQRYENVDADQSLENAENHSGFKWSRLIDADVLIAEIKRQQMILATNLKSIEGFKSGGDKQCRLAFTMLAVLFAVIDEYDVDVRWQHDAAALRDLFAHAGFSCDRASGRTIGDAVFAEAIERRDHLEELVRGSRRRLDRPAKLASWDKVADFSMLMRRMERSYEEQISPQLVNPQVFRRGARTIQHEAQLLAMLAEIICREGYDYWDDEAYAQYSRQLRNAAIELGTANSERDFGRTCEAANRVGKNCSNCHADYRG